MDNFEKIKGFRMPAEFEPHDGCIMIWPVRPGSWPYGGKAAQKAFCRVAALIAESEPVFFLADSARVGEVDKILETNAPGAQITVLPIESDDAWARDVAPTFVIDDKGGRMGIDWCFNAWGGEVDGLYPNWERDDMAASALCRELGEQCFDAHPFVLEGGSIHSDGQGTILTTEACLLSRGRNPQLGRQQIEEVLCKTLGGKKVVWLPCGIYQDETNEHVDNICAFVKPGEVVLAWTDDKNDPQYAMSAACEEALRRQTDAAGRFFRIHKLPIPKKPVVVSEGDLQGYVFEEGEDVRDAGERLAASYVNFYIANGSVIVPGFGDEMDKTAVDILGHLFPDRKICQVPARDILLGGGNIHCITQQIPKR